MTQTQKKSLEWPLIVVLFFFLQALEISILRLPWGLGPVHVVPVLIAYLAVTRNWAWLMMLTLIFSFMGSFTVGYPWPIYVAVQLWTALMLKLVMLTFALEGRRTFTGLVAIGSVISKTLMYLLLKSLAKTLPLGLEIKGAVVSTALLVVVSWFAFPLLAAWDAYFEHEADEARELKPGALR